MVVLVLAAAFVGVLSIRRRGLRVASLAGLLRRGSEGDSSSAGPKDGF
jgi:UPF0716 family protein affecting phage T7 exclusion